MLPHHSRLPLAELMLCLSLVGLGGCRSAGQFLDELLRERPPAPIDSMSVASDARVDSLGYVVGSFVGEGTSRAVHLLSSDTGFVAALVRRYRPDLMQPHEPWGPLAREGVVTLIPAGRRLTTAGAPKIDRALVGTLLSFRQVRLAPYETLRRSIFWRRLEPISDFGFERDNLWMEQVDVGEGNVIWGIIQPRGNVVVAAAEVEGPCR